MNSQRFVICDIEATGLDEDKDIIEIALITLEDDKVVDVFETLINPLRPVPEFIQNLTSISLRELNEAPKFYDVADSIRMRLEGSVFVSHNTDFDLNLLKKKYQEMGQELKLKNFCTLKIAQEEIPGLKNYNLDALCSFFHIKIRDRHRAIGDARATLELFLELRDLRLKNYPKIMYLPHHEKFFKHLSGGAGLLAFKNQDGKIVRLEAAFDMLKRAKELLEVRPDNRELLLATESIEGEPTGSALIAEFRKLLFHPLKIHWAIVAEAQKSGEKKLVVRPFKKHVSGLWYFKELMEAKKKLRSLESQLKGETFAYREGGKSKEEILKHNQKIETLSKESKFPADNLLLLGEGRTIGEKSLILIRNGHVLGYGHSMESEEIINQDPERFLTHRFSFHLGADLVAMRYLRILKNLRNKKEGWRSLADRGKVLT